MLNKNSYIFGYATAICLICSLLLAFAATSLQPYQEANIKLDIRKNIMLALGLLEAGEKIEAEAINNRFETTVEGLVIDKEGNLIEGLSPEDIDEEEWDTKLPVFRSSEEGKVTGYAFPIVGKGLWSTLYGYLALEADIDTVKGITFYQQGETAGLGAEIASKWFTDNFYQKKVRSSSGDFIGVEVVKGKAVDSSKPIEHVVDGISGATITADAVTKMILAGLLKYEVYLNNQKGVN